MSNNNVQSVFDRVTQKIISDLKRGVRPWQKPWSGEHAGSRIVRPRRHNGGPYNGVNILLLWDAALEKGYLNPTWMTFQQAEEYGAHVRKGEKASYVVYANKVTKVETDVKTGEDVEKQIPFLRGYNVFNVEQIEGLPEKFLLQPETPNASPAVGRLESVDHFITNAGVLIRHGGDKAFYSVQNDYVQMPFIDAFKDGESYYATLAHETTHWTRHETRLNRNFGRVTWGDEGYAKEELVAEIGAAFLCADLGITPETREDHAAYVESWLKALKDDKKFIFTAAAHATRAVEFLKSKQPALAPDVITNNTNPYSTLYVSSSMTIDQHEWRLLIERNGKGLCCRYEFKDRGSSVWKRSLDWSKSDANDTYSDLPHGLSKLYAREQPMLVKFGLIKPRMNQQLSLSF